MVKRQTDVTSELLATGEATMSQLAQLFETDAKTLPQRLKGVIPSGKRNGYRVYKIKEAAAHLVKPGYEIEQYIKQIAPHELNPLMLKEFWNGQKARLAFEKELGNYWPTSDVVELVAVICAGIRQTLLLITDDVEREEGVTDGQRKAFRRITDAGIVTMQEQVAERLKDYYADREDDRGPETVEPLVDSGRDDIGLPEAEEDEEVDI